MGDEINTKLRGKVEMDKLYEMSSTISKQFNTEISNKLDKKELKMRTTVINKKIDFLEKKVTKALIDSLMEIHTDEAPLIVKQSWVGDNCASCGQLVALGENRESIGNGKGSHNRSNSMMATMNDFKNMQNTQYDKIPKDNFNKSYNLKSLHDHCQKFGGSYSRILANSNAEGLKEEFSQLNTVSNLPQRLTTEINQIDNKIKQDKNLFPSIWPSPLKMNNWSTILSIKYLSCETTNKQPG